MLGNCRRSACILLATWLAVVVVEAQQLKTWLGIARHDTVGAINAAPRPTWQEASRIGAAPAVLIGVGLASWGIRDDVRDLRNRHLPDFRSHYDDVLQYAPAVTAVGLKLAGVESRNDWKRMILSYGVGLAINNVVVQGMKHTFEVRRPDGTNRKSFPSGHTANAFLNASFLHHEFGHTHTAYSLAGYGMAVATGAGRSVNDRHWISDILVGAGIGILSSRLGYFFIDRLYGNRGDRPVVGIDGSEYPSYLALRVGYAHTLHAYPSELGFGANCVSGVETGIEGAWYFSRHWGVGGSLWLTNYPAPESKRSIADGEIVLTPQSAGLLNLTVGPQYTHHFTDRWMAHARIEGGLSRGSSVNTTYLYSSPRAGYPGVASTAHHRTAFAGLAGIGATCKLTGRLGLTPYIEYRLLRPRIAVANYDLPMTPADETAEYRTARQPMDYLTAGMKLTAFF